MGIAPPQPKQTDLARQFLMSELGGGEAKPVKALTEKAETLGIGYETLKVAKKILGIVSDKVERAWYWKLK